jgi:hypothetical protein
LNNFQMAGCKCLNFDELNSQNFVLSSKLEGIEKKNFMMKLMKKTDSKPDSELNSYIIENNPRLHVYFPEYSADLYSIEDPLKIKMQTISYLLNPLSTRVSDIYLALLSFIDYYSYTDNEIFKFEEKLIFDSKSDYNLNSMISNEMMKISFILSGKTFTYKRSYLLFEDYLGNTVGYLWNIIILVYIGSWAYNSFGSSRFMAEKFFFHNSDLRRMFVSELGLNENDWDNENEPISEKKTGGISPNFNLINENTKKVPLNPECTNSNLKNKDFSVENMEGETFKNTINKENVILDLADFSKNKEAINEINDGVVIDRDKKQKEGSVPLDPKNKKIRKNKFSIFFFEYIASFLPFYCTKKNLDSRRDKLFKGTEYFYYYYMDINNYLKMAIEFELIKSLVLSREKRYLLENFKPFVKTIYGQDYVQKLSKFYNPKIEISDVEKMLNGIRDSKNENETEFLEELKKFI